MLDKELFKSKGIKASSYLIIILLLIISIATLSKYTKGAFGLSESRVAKWENDLQLVEKELIIDDTKGNKVGFKFSINSASEVTSKYSLNFKNIPVGIGLEINDSEHNKKIIIDNNTITIKLDSNEATFNKEVNTVLNDISYSKTNDNGKETLKFVNQRDNTGITVEIIDGKQNIIFTDWEVLAPENITKEFNGIFEVCGDGYLISETGIIASALFEQVD